MEHSSDALHIQGKTMRRLAACGTILVLLIALVVAVRLPFLANPLLSEEGYFAFLVANPVASYKLSTDGTPQAIAANIDAKPILTSFQHAIVPYSWGKRNRRSQERRNIQGGVRHPARSRNPWLSSPERRVYKMEGLAKFPVGGSTLPVLPGRDGVTVKVPESPSDSPR